MSSFVATPKLVIGHGIFLSFEIHIALDIMRTTIPAERQVLRKIFDMYEASYPGDKLGDNDPFIAIDINAIASKLNCKPHLLFGILYYFLEHKYRHKTDEGTYISLFAIRVGDTRHAINYPYLAAILAGHEQEQSKYRWSLILSSFALLISIVAIIVQLRAGK